MKALKATLQQAELPFSSRLSSFRGLQGLSKEELAEKIGVSTITLYRWERGTARPSPLAAERLEALGFGKVHSRETNEASIPRIKTRYAKQRPSLKEEAKVDTQIQSYFLDNYNTELQPSPFVKNGPPDQSEFHKKLIEMQLSSKGIAKDALLGRLSLVESTLQAGVTAQHLLESPKRTSVSWNSNYGTHGWHRYVGRFPPHVVRTLLNYFGADERSVVCDPFAGSGTTAVECRLLGIPFVGMEICPLSCLMTRTKACFPESPELLTRLRDEYCRFYDMKWNKFIKDKELKKLTHGQILKRAGNPVPTFANIERWFTPEALLGVSITVEFGMSKEGYSRDIILLALSSKMRSIGNVDVDVVRAEYSKVPRKDVNVRYLVERLLKKMAGNIKDSISSHKSFMTSASQFTLHEGSVLDAKLPDESVDHIITSPPYGVEAISYLRTHLLSYRSLAAHLKHDPYYTRDKTIGSEYLTDHVPDTEYRSIHTSAVCKRFFSKVSCTDKKYLDRRYAMIQFFDDMLELAERMSSWLKDNGRVAFIVGNKRLGEDIIPTDKIVIELFKSCGLEFQESISHKLKTNNSNSQVPWQEKVIQEEAILIFRRQKRKRK